MKQTVIKGIGYLAILLYQSSAESSLTLVWISLSNYGAVASKTAIDLRLSLILINRTTH